MDKDFYTKEISHSKMLDALNTLAYRYKTVFMTTIGSSVCSLPIPAVRVGEGNTKLLYVAAHHGAEHITAGILIKFLFELCGYFEHKNKIYGIDPEYIFHTRTLYFIPMVNPDGTELSINGASTSSPLYQRLIKMNGSENFSKWQANARGVDLNHNYDAGFYEYKKLEKEICPKGPCPSRYSGEYPESEPETTAVCSFIRTLAPFKYLFSFHTQGEEIYSGYNGFEPRGSVRCAKMLAAYSGYTYTEPAEAPACYGGLKDWYVKSFSLPAFTIECGRGKNPLPPSELIPIYFSLRKMLFRSLVL